MLHLTFPDALPLKYPVPILSPLPQYKRRTYIVNEDYTLVWNGHVINIPKGFKFDGASIPAAAWPLTYTPFNPHVVIAALIHDYLYLTHQLARYESDLLFRDMCIECYAGTIKTYAMYSALRLFGGFSWKVNADDLARGRALYKEVKLREDAEIFYFPEYLKDLSEAA